MIWEEDSAKIIDCTDQILGKVVQRTCIIIRGLDSVKYHPTAVKRQGQCVKLINTHKLKPIDPYRKVYSHTRYGGGFKVQFAKDMLRKDPVKYIKKVIKGHLPKTSSRYFLLRRVRVYP